jgi:hypothetical protein
MRFTDRSLAVPIALLLAGSAGVGYFADDIPALAVTAASHAAGACVIKGNISSATGERIYHVPGQKYYAATRISPQYGERWFCSEAEARVAGWRKAKN